MHEPTILTESDKAAKAAAKAAAAASAAASAPAPPAEPPTPEISISPCEDIPPSAPTTPSANETPPDQTLSVGGPGELQRQRSRKNSSEMFKTVVQTKVASLNAFKRGIKMGKGDLVMHDGVFGAEGGEDGKEDINVVDLSNYSQLDGSKV